MYNPANLNECEKEKERDGHVKQRRIADSVMTGIGLIASLSSLPQVLKIFQTGSIEGISLLTQLIALGTVIAWFIYGFYIKNKPLIITTTITILILGIVVIQMFIYQ